MSEWGVHSAMPSPMPNASCWSLHRTIAGIFSSIEHERKRLSGFATAARVGAAASTSVRLTASGRYRPCNTSL
jgi:hypothetical protein